MLELKNIKKSFEGDQIFKGFSKTFLENSIYLLTGSNGCGKTTLLKIIKGIIVPDDGNIKFMLEPREHHVAYVDANNRSFLHRLSVKENLRYFLSLNKKNRDLSVINHYLSIFKVENLLERNFSLLSAGQMQLISIIRGLLEEPRILLIDEAMSNLDREIMETVLNFFESYVSESKRAIIICSHNSKLPIKFREVIGLG